MRNIPQTRPAIVRTLVVAGPDGLAAGLITQRRDSRSIVYSANYDALADLVKFLMEDCCAGHPMVREGVERSDGCCKTDAAGIEGDVFA